MAFSHVSAYPSPSVLQFATHKPPQSIHFPSILFTNPSSLLSRSYKVLSVGNDQLGDFGARDPFPAEIESNFADKVLGNVDTEHKILVPSVSALSLSQRDCTPISPSQSPMSQEEAQKLLRKLVGWKMVNVEGSLRLQCIWKVRDFGCGFELVSRIYKTCEAVGHYPDLHLERASQVRAELWTNSIGGLSMNDFIVASKIDEIKTMDLLPRKRVWA